jgi:hypothetical protein
MRCGWRNDLRSRSVCSSFSGVLALLAEVPTRSIGASTTVAALVAAVGITMALNILHGLIVVAGRGLLIVIVTAATHGGELSVHIHLLALQQLINDLSDLEVSGAEPRGVAGAALGLRLQPEEVPLGRRAKLKDEDTTVGLGGWLAGRSGIERDEVAICGDHDQIKLGLVKRDISGSPAEVDEVCANVSLRLPREADKSEGIPSSE